MTRAKRSWAEPRPNGGGGEARITREGLPIVAILATGAGAQQLGVLAALATLVGVAAAPWAGVAADRRRRRPLMVGCDGLRAVALASVPVAAYLHALTFLQIAVVTALVGGLTTVFDTADRPGCRSSCRARGCARATRPLRRRRASARPAGRR